MDDTIGPSKGGAIQLQGIPILVVDDDEDSREVLRALLEHCGADVTVVDSARRGLEVFPTVRPRVVVSDIAMPEEDGYWLIRELRRQPEGDPSRLRAVAVTGYSEFHERRQVLDAGYQEYLKKPVRPDTLCDIIKELAAPDDPAPRPCTVCGRPMVRGEGRYRVDGADVHVGCYASYRASGSTTPAS
ncbi:MAG: response regulator [Candidatus Rokuibacteriota bacterium]